MRDEFLDHVETAPDGDALPLLTGVESLRPLEVIAVVRCADQICMRYRRRGPRIELRANCDAARALAALAT
jgi:hypothetical protein